MRVEAYSVGSVLHVVKRGTRGVLIAPTEKEKWRFLRSLFYLNCTDSHLGWESGTADSGLWIWPAYWKPRVAITEILAWTLMPNHFHLVLRETTDGGIAKFMQRLSGSMSTYFNSAHNEHGTLFQGGYKGRVVSDDQDLRYLAAYVMGKNVFELYPGGIEQALKEFSQAWQFAIDYKFSSLQCYATARHSPVLPEGENILKNLFRSETAFRTDIRDMVSAWYERTIDKDSIRSEL